jgi:hypothetical protein
MGNTSELIFEKVAKSSGCIVERSGANKSLIDHRGMNFYLRNQPDYQLQTPNGAFYQVEVKGGNSDVVKVKLESLEAARYWDMFAPFCFFFTNTNTNEFALYRQSVVRQIVRKHRIGIDRFPDGNAFYPVPRDLLTWRPIDATLLQLTQHTSQTATKDE